MFHVLHRHLAPRHPPYALSSLTCRDAEKLTFFMVAIQLLRFSSCGGLAPPPAAWPPGGGPQPAGLGTTARRSTVLCSVRPGNSAGPSEVGAAAPRTARGKMPARSIRLGFPAPCRSPRAPSTQRPGGDEGTRTPDIRLAKAALSQLSYIPAPLSSTFSDDPQPPGIASMIRCCGPSRIRTWDLSLIRGTLSPTELKARGLNN